MPACAGAAVPVAEVEARVRAGPSGRACQTHVMSSVAVQALGWAGSVVLVASLLQSRVLRLRQLNLVATLILMTFNALVGVWPMVAMNIAIACIDAWHLSRLLRSRHDPASYAVVEVVPDDRYLAHLLDHHRPDIVRYNPGFDWDGGGPGDLAFLVLRDDETIGFVLAHDAGDGVARIALDYVSRRFRDFTPGEFVFRESGLFTERGFRRIVAPRGMRQADAYLSDIGFRTEGDDRVLDLAAA